MDRGRLVGVWKRVLSLSWPVMAERTFRTAMRTTDILVTAQFSAATVVAMAPLVGAGFRYSGWAGRAAGMMAERGSASEEIDG